MCGAFPNKVAVQAYRAYGHTWFVCPSATGFVCAVCSRSGVADLSCSGFTRSLLRHAFLGPWCDTVVCMWTAGVSIQSGGRAFVGAGGAHVGHLDQRATACVSSVFV